MKSKKIMLYLHSVTREVNMAVKSWEVSDEFWARGSLDTESET